MDAKIVEIVNDNFKGVSYNQNMHFFYSYLIRLASKLLLS